MNKILLIVAALLLTTACSRWCDPPYVNSYGPYVGQPDAEVTKNVMEGITAYPNVEAVTVDGRVYLLGWVLDNNERQTLLSIVKNTPGVKTLADSTKVWTKTGGQLPAKLSGLDTEGQVTLYINFDTGKATLKPDAADVIDEIASALNSRPQMQVKLEGHTDNVGSAAFNKKLSDDRANAVMVAIVAKGIDKGRLSAEGFGLERPIADNNTAAGRAQNRRVNLVKVQ